MQTFYSSVQWTSRSHLRHLDVGGAAFGQDYIPVVRQLIGRAGRAFEFCAGPGFIGFSLLAHGLCRSHCLSDTNPEAVAVARETIKRNGLENRVSVYESDALDQIPPSEKWDLVVSNLPHFADQFAGSIRRFDPSWSIHRKFYASLKPHMNPGCTVLVQENYEGSNESDFTDMIRAGGLRYDGSFMYADPQRRKMPRYPLFHVVETSRGPARGHLALSRHHPRRNLDRCSAALRKRYPDNQGQR